MQRQNISSGTPWEEQVGYSRAVRMGKLVFVTGTLAVDEQGNTIGVGDVREQTRAALEKIEKALGEAGATMADVVRTRLYVTNIDDWPQVAEAHRAVFADLRPCTTMVEVSRLFTPEALIEIEADAVLA